LASTAGTITYVVDSSSTDAQAAGFIVVVVVIP
jgi:hypothetical protein